MRPTAIHVVASSVRVSVCLCVYVTGMNPTKTAKQIKMPFDMCALVGPHNYVLDGGPDPPPGKGQFWGEEGAGP